MSEISREEAIKIFKCRSGNEYTVEKINQALDKAISDMEKLEKIEKVITNIDCSECGCKDIEEECCDCYKTWFRLIVQIVKN